jgi:hypothetical protein
MTNQSLIDKILSWLSTQGYATEMRVAKQLNEAGFDTLKSSFYDDPETGISREIDVIGRLKDDIGLLYVFAVIECKMSSKPWIVFTSDNSGFNRIHTFSIMTNNARKLVIDNLNQMKGFEWFMKHGRVGYGITTAFTSNEDETFKAGMSATKAAISIAKKEVVSSGDEIVDLYHFLFPTVVLDGQLFESYLGEDGNPIVAEIDSVPLLFPVKIADSYGSAIQIVTSNSFDRYCSELSLVYNSLMKLLRLAD